MYILFIFFNMYISIYIYKYMYIYIYFIYIYIHTIFFEISAPAVVVVFRAGFDYDIEI